MNFEMNIAQENRNIQKDKAQKTYSNEAKRNAGKSESNINWTTEDKEVLLQALKKYGSKNFEAISEMLPNISCQEIKSKISEYSELAKHVYEDELLNDWLNCGLYKSGDSLIPQALLFIQLFENHPSISESEGYDFRAIYKFLYRSCIEETSYFELSPKDRDLLCSLLSITEEKLWPKCQTEVLEYIGRVYNRRNIKRVYPGKKKHSFKYDH